MHAIANKEDLFNKSTNFLADAGSHVKYPSVKSVADRLATIPTVPVLTAGSIPFSNGSTLTQDNDNLFWDDANNRLGIGANNPGARLDVRSQGALATDIAFRVRNSANTLNTLQVAGDGTTTFNMGVGSSVSFGGAGGSSIRIDGIRLFQRSGATFAFGDGQDGLSFRTVSSVRMFINSSGNTGFGTTQPLRALHVVGALPVLTAINAYNGAIIENSDNVQLVIATGANREALLSFGDNANNTRGAIRYVNTTNTLSLRANNVDRVSIDSAGKTRIFNDSNSTDSRVLEVDNTYTGTGASSTMRVKQRAQNNTSGSSRGFTMQSEVFGTAVNTAVTSVVGGEYLNLFRADTKNVTIGSSVGLNLRSPSITEVSGGIVAITNSIGSLINNQGNAKVVNSYAIKIDSQSGSTAKNYAIYSEGGTSYHKGWFGIDEPSPTSKLHVTGLPEYADNTAALAGGMTAGAFYRTATGELRVTY